MAVSPIKVLKWMKYTTLFLSLLGIGLCGYSIYVSSRKEANNDYQAYCDIDDNISCSKVFTSRWGKGFGFLGDLVGEDSPLIVSNGVYGIIFYMIVILLGQINYDIAAKIQKYFVLLSNLMSIYLASILFFVLKDICVVCITTYIINLLITICCYVRVSYSTSSKYKKQSQKGSSNTSSKNKKNKNSNANKNTTEKQKGHDTNKSNNISQPKNVSQHKNASQNKNQAKNANHINNKTSHQNKNATQKGNKNNSKKNSNKSQNSKGSKRKAD